MKYYFYYYLVSFRPVINMSLRLSLLGSNKQNTNFEKIFKMYSNVWSICYEFGQKLWRPSSYNFSQKLSNKWMLTL